MTFQKRFALISSILAASCVVWGAYELLTFTKKPSSSEEIGKMTFPKINWSDLRASKKSSGELQLVPCDPSLLSQSYLQNGPQYESVNSIELEKTLQLSPLFSVSQTPLIANTAPPEMFEQYQIKKWNLPVYSSIDKTVSSIGNLPDVTPRFTSSEKPLVAVIAPKQELLQDEKIKQPKEKSNLPLSPYMVPPSKIAIQAEELPYEISSLGTKPFTLKTPLTSGAALVNYTVPTRMVGTEITEGKLFVFQPIHEISSMNLSERFTSRVVIGKETFFKAPQIATPQATETSVYVVKNQLNEGFLEALHEKAPLPVSILEQLPQMEEQEVYDEEILTAISSKQAPRKESVKRIARQNASQVSLPPNFNKQSLDIQIKDPTLLLSQSKKITNLQQRLFNEFLTSVTTSSEPFVETDLLSDVQVDQWQEHCTFNLQYTKDPYGDGYFFLVTVEPTFTTTENNLHQNLYFLVDRSNSIEKHRYQTFKKAVSRALRELDVSDSFNILLFDHQVVAFQKESIPATTTNIERAETFLEAQSHGNFLAAGDVYKSLRHLVPTKIDTKELHSAILITDGNSLLTTSKKQKAIQRWKDQFTGSVNLFTAAVGKGNNLNLLSLFSSFGQGKLIYSDTHASFPRKVAAAVRGLRSPLAKNLHAFVKSSTSQVDLLTDNQFTPPLFNGQPLSFLGYAQNLSDFTFVLEGKNKDGWFEIRKNFNFTNAKAARAPVEKAVELHRAQMHYRRFLEKGLEQDLDQAEECLKSAESRWNFD